MLGYIGVVEGSEPLVSFGLGNGNDNGLNLGFWLFGFEGLGLKVGALDSGNPPSPYQTHPFKLGSLVGEQ